MRAYTLTLTAGDTTYRLATLIAAIKASEDTNFSQVDIQADTGNATAVLIGDSALDGTRYGALLPATTGTFRSFVSGSGANTISTANIYVRGVTTAGMKVHVILLSA